MTQRSCITGPFKIQKRPRGRVLETKAYLVFATFGGLFYLLYLAVSN